MAKTNKAFIFGLGYIGQHLAQSLMADGWQVAGTCRSKEKQADLEGKGIEAHIFTGEAPMDNGPDLLSGTTHLVSTLYAGGSRAESEDDMFDYVVRYHGKDLASLSSLNWAGMISATSVYGKVDGDWVDETYPIKPALEGGGADVVAERQWQELRQKEGVPIHIFRLTHIYGPGRNQLRGVVKGSVQRIDNEGRFSCRIHVDDIVGILRASMAKPNPGAVYNMADDKPTENRVPLEYSCELMGVELPPLLPFDRDKLPPRIVQLFLASRRIKNDRVKDELGYAFKYPTYREGLASMVDLEKAALAEERFGPGATARHG